MKSIDYQFKDAHPVDTVNRIRGILEHYGISATETPGNSGIKNCYSSHVTIDGTNLGSNGKGITPEFCSASAHAELMERLQSDQLKLKVDPSSFADGIEVDRNGLMEYCGKWLDRIGEVASTSDGEKLATEDIVNGIFQIVGSDKTVIIPFYDVCTNSYTYFPTALFNHLYFSNGLAAGNTMEEALVQGFSEIVERHNREKFLCGDMVPPNIPEDYLKQFPTAYEIICDIRKNGYDVYVKDCSLGDSFPLVATVLIDRKTHGYHVHMGASPVFEIALERSLTEMFQGRTIAKIADISTLYNGKTGQRRSAEDIRHVHAFGTITYPLSFFNGTPSYEFKPFPDCRSKDNKALLRDILTYLKERGKTLLIRDFSHLGFPTFRLIVPGMSEVFYENFTHRIPLLQFKNISTKTFRDMKDATADDIFSTLLLSKYQRSLYRQQNFSYSFLADIFLAIPANKDTMLGLLHFAYAEWTFGNRAQALAYAKEAANFSKGSDRAYLDCLDRAFVFAEQGISRADVLSGLQLFYEDEAVSEVRKVLKENRNPFERFVLKCDPDECGGCTLKDNCLRAGSTAVRSIVSQAITEFDNEAAFNRIEALFTQL